MVLSQSEIVEAVNSKNQMQIIGKEITGLKDTPAYRG